MAYRRKNNTYKLWYRARNVPSVGTVFALVEVLEYPPSARPSSHLFDSELNASGITSGRCRERGGPVRRSSRSLGMTDQELQAAKEVWLLMNGWTRLPDGRWTYLDSMGDSWRWSYPFDHAFRVECSVQNISPNDWGVAGEPGS